MSGIKKINNYDHELILQQIHFESKSIKEYLRYKSTRKAKVVIYTAISDSFDDLIQHKYICKDFDYICFTDAPVKNKGIWEIVYTEICENRSKAMQREKQLKSYQGRQFIKNLMLHMGR